MKIITKIIPLVLFVPSLVYAKDGYYGSIYTGLNFPSSKVKIKDEDTYKLDASPSVGVAYGYNHKALTFDISYDGKISDIKNEKDSRVISNMGLFNITYNLNHNGIIKPFIGISAGVASSKIKSDFNKNGNLYYLKTNLAFVYQGKAGLKVSVTDNLDIFADARFTQITRAGFKNVENSPKVSVNYVSANIGFSYFLGGQDEYYNFRK